jgi:hypothetical protein
MATPSFGSGAAATHGAEDAAQPGPSATPEKPPSRPAHAEIELRAYFIYLREGGGDPGEHWNRAEREIADQSRDQ